MGGWWSVCFEMRHGVTDTHAAVVVVVDGPGASCWEPSVWGFLQCGVLVLMLFLLVGDGLTDCLDRVWLGSCPGAGL